MHDKQRRMITKGYVCYLARPILWALAKVSLVSRAYVLTFGQAIYCAVAEVSKGKLAKSKVKYHG